MLLQIFTVLCITLIQKCTTTTPSIQTYIDLTKQPFFVDKSEFIKTFFEEDNKHIFITAPPGFGKTTNLQMLRLFSELELDSNHKPKIYTSGTAHQIFQPLVIFKNYTDIVEKHMAQHIVIYLDLGSDATMENSIDIQKSVTFFNNKLYESFESYKWILGISKEELTNTYKITADQIELLEKLDQKTLPNDNNSTRVLYDFAKILNLYFGKEVIILIDNYDSVLSNFCRPTQTDIEIFYQYVSTVLCDAFNNPITSHSLVMGINSMVLPFMLTKLNKSEYYHFLSDHRFNPYYGFTDTEATNLLMKYNCSEDCRSQVKKFYNGYKSLSKTIELYNPSSLTQYLTNINDPNALRPYKNVTAKDYKFLMSFQDERMFGQMLTNLMINMTVKFDHHKSYTLENFTTFFNVCEFYDYKVSASAMLFSYFFDHGYLSHTFSKIIPYLPIEKIKNSSVPVFEAPNLEVWHNVKELCTIVLSYDPETSPKRTKDKKAGKKAGKGEKAPKVKKGGNKTQPKGNKTKKGNANKTTFAQTKLTGAKNKTTIGHSETTGAKIEMTMAQNHTTVAKIEATVGQSETTVAKTETLAGQNKTTIGHSETIGAKIEMTMAQNQTTVAKIEATVDHSETTVAKTETLVGQNETTIAKNEATIAETGSTMAQSETTVAKIETSAQTEATTAKTEA